MSHEPPVSLWPDPDALGPVTDLYELTMMAGYLASGMADRSARRSSCSCASCRRTAPTWSSPDSSRRIGDLLRLAFAPEQIDVDPPLADLPGDRSVDHGRAGQAAIRGRRLGGARGDGRVPRRDALAGHGAAAPGAVGRDLPGRRRSPIRPWWRRRRRGSSRWPAAGRSRNSAPAAGTDRMRDSSRPVRRIIAGFAGTSHVEAARLLGIPASGTMAHSWVQAFPDEPSAFAAFARVFGDSSTLLVDTYDTLEGVRHAAAIEPPIQAIRIDSGDLEDLTRRSRAILDERGRTGVKIMASGDLDEYRIARLVESGAAGRRLRGRDRADHVARRSGDGDGLQAGRAGRAGEVQAQPGQEDVPDGQAGLPPPRRVGPVRRRPRHRADETAEGEPLLVPIVRAGRLVQPLPSLDDIRARCRDQLAALAAAPAGRSTRRPIIRSPTATRSRTTPGG